MFTLTDLFLKTLKSLMATKHHIEARQYICDIILEDANLSNAYASLQYLRIFIKERKEILIEDGNRFSDIRYELDLILKGQLKSKLNIEDFTQVWECLVVLTTNKR
jgi:hypothetical protein